MNQSILPVPSLDMSSAEGSRRGAILLAASGRGRRGGARVCELEVRQRLLEPAPRLVVDLTLEERHERPDRVDREPRLGELAGLELRERERRERGCAREQELPDPDRPHLLDELFDRRLSVSRHGFSNRPRSAAQTDTRAKPACPEGGVASAASGQPMRSPTATCSA